MSCDRVALYIRADGKKTYRAPVRVGATPPELIFRWGWFYSLNAVFTTEDVPVPPGPTISEGTTP